VIEAAVTNVIRPAVAADDPNALADQGIGQFRQEAGAGVLAARQLAAQGFHAGALGTDAGVGGLIGIEQFGGQGFADFGRQFNNQFAGKFGLLVEGQAHAQAKLGVVFKQRVGPGRAAAFAVGGPGGGGQVAAIDGGTAGGIGNHHAVAKQLRYQADVRGLAAAAAGARELEQRF